MTDLPVPHPGEFLLYETEDGRTRVECRFVADTLWLAQAGMADLFQTSKQNIAKHLKAIFAEGELAPPALRMFGDEAADDIIDADRSQQQYEVAMVPPSIEKQRARGKPSGAGELAQTPGKEKSEQADRQKGEQEGVGVEEQA